MAKKAKKIQNKGKPAAVAAGAKGGSLPVSSISKTSAARPAAIVAQTQNYDYVKTDLVRIGIIAGVLLLILVVLTLVPSLKS
jgi:hypothetical protein